MYIEKTVTENNMSVTIKISIDSNNIDDLIRLLDETNLFQFFNGNC